MIVADAKYKAEKPSGFPQADLYQMLAYCTVLGLREGHLIYARGNEPALVHDVRNSRVRITAHTLNLDQEPGRVLAEVGDIGRAMMASATESIN